MFKFIIFDYIFSHILALIGKLFLKIYMMHRFDSTQLTHKRVESSRIERKNLPNPRTPLRYTYHII